MPPRYADDERVVVDGDDGGYAAPARGSSSRVPSGAAPSMGRLTRAARTAPKQQRELQPSQHGQPLISPRSGHLIDLEDEDEAEAEAEVRSYPKAQQQGQEDNPYASALAWMDRESEAEESGHRHPSARETRRGLPIAGAGAGAAAGVGTRTSHHQPTSSLQYSSNGTEDLVSPDASPPVIGGGRKANSKLYDTRSPRAAASASARSSARPSLSSLRDARPGPSILRPTSTQEVRSPDFPGAFPERDLPDVPSTRGTLPAAPRSRKAATHVPVRDERYDARQTPTEEDEPVESRGYSLDTEREYYDRPGVQEHDYADDTPREEYDYDYDDPDRTEEAEDLEQHPRHPLDTPREAYGEYESDGTGADPQQTKTAPRHPEDYESEGTEEYEQGQPASRAAPVATRDEYDEYGSEVHSDHGREAKAPRHPLAQPPESFASDEEQSHVGPSYEAPRQAWTDSEGESLQGGSDVELAPTVEPPHRDVAGPGSTGKRDAAPMGDAGPKDLSAAAVPAPADVTMATAGSDVVPIEDEEPFDTNLTPERRHYLLRALVALQLSHETSELEKLGTLTVYGPPFSPLRPPVGRVGKDLINEYTKDLVVVPPAEDPYGKDGLEPGSRSDDAVVRRTERITQPVILRHLFHTHLRTFPGLDTAATKFWQLRVQVLLDELAARNLSTSLERSEVTQRRVWALSLVEGLGKFFARGVGVRGPGEVRGPGRGVKGSDKWGVGKQWGKGTVKRGLDRPILISPELQADLDELFAPGTKSNASGDPDLEDEVDHQWRLAGQRARQEAQDAAAFKETLIEQEDGLEKLWDLVLSATKVSDLPARIQRAWAHFRQSLASALYDLLVLSSEADQLVKTLKSAHALFPYWGAKQLLRYNQYPPHVMVQSLLSLLLARPSGEKEEKDKRGEQAQSLLQRIFGFILTRDKETIKDTLLKPLRTALGEAGQGPLANRIVDYVTYADRVERCAIERKTLETGDDVLTTILLESPPLGHGPEKPNTADLLKPVDTETILTMQRAFALSPWRGHVDAAYPPESSRYDETVVADAEDAYQEARPPVGTTKAEEVEWELTEEEETMAYDFAQLKLLLREARRLRDREELVDVVNGPLVPTIVKDVLEYVFFDGLRAADKVGVDLSRTLGDIKALVDDLLLVRQRSVVQPDQCGPAEWVALLQRHEDHLLSFVHDLAPVAEPLLEWVQLGTDYLALSTSDPLHPANRTQPNIEVNLDELLEDAKPEDRVRILREVDYLSTWSLWQIVRHELEARREILFGLPPNEAEALNKKGKSKAGAEEDELGLANLAPDEHFAKAVGDVDRLLYRLMRAHGVRVDDGLCRTEARGTEAQLYPQLWYDDLDPTGQQVMAEERVKELRYVPLRTDYPPPQLLHTRKLLPPFRHQLVDALPDWTVPRKQRETERKTKVERDEKQDRDDRARARAHPASDPIRPPSRPRDPRNSRDPMAYGRPGPGPRYPSYQSDLRSSRSRGPTDHEDWRRSRFPDQGPPPPPPKKGFTGMMRGLSLSSSRQTSQSGTGRRDPRDAYSRAPYDDWDRRDPYRDPRGMRSGDSGRQGPPGSGAPPRGQPLGTALARGSSRDTGGGRSSGGYYDDYPYPPPEGRLSRDRLPPPSHGDPRDVPRRSAPAARREWSRESQGGYGNPYGSRAPRELRDRSGGDEEGWYADRRGPRHSVNGHSNGFPGQQARKGSVRSKIASLLGK